MKYTLPLLFLALIFGCKNSTQSPSISSNTRPSAIVIADSTPKIPAPSATTLAVTDEKPVFPVYRKAQKPANSETISINEPSAAIIAYNPQNNLAALFKEPEEIAQTFIFNTTAAQNFLCNQGSRLFIPADAFLFENSGQPVKGTITLSVSEYYDLGDIILSKLSTRTADQLLETGGMVYLSATADGQPCKLAPGKQIEIDFSGTEIWDKMSAFYGVSDSSDNIIWEASQDAAKNRIIHFTDDPKVPWYYGDAVNISYTHCDKMPEYPGGNFALKDFVNGKLNYPDSALNAGFEGKLFVSFIISDSGFVRNIQIDSCPGFGLEAAIRKIFSEMPLWKPGFENNMAVDVSITLPVEYTFSNDDFFLGIRGEDPALKATKKNKIRDTGDGWFNGAFYRGDNIFSASGNPTPSVSTVSQPDTFSVNSSNQFISLSLISTTKLGWVNCDRFYNSDAPRINYTVDIDENRAAEFTMVFSDINAVLKGVKKNRSFIFYNVPEDQPVTLFGIQVSNGEYYYCMKETVVSRIRDQDYSFILTSKDELLELVKTFDKQMPTAVR